MPKDFIWGPVSGKNAATGRDIFPPDTPQVFFWAYILIGDENCNFT